MEYLVVSVFTTSAGCEALADELAPITGCCEVVDTASLGDMLAQTRGRWDYVDEALLQQPAAEPQVRFYLAGDVDGAAVLRTASQRVAEIKAADSTGFYGPLRIEVAPMENQDWENSWKEYFKPLPIGQRLLICPSWEQAEAQGRTVLHIDPSSSFGTGAHATTGMCLEQLDSMELTGKRVLDLGCGSGILSCAASLLGAAHTLACDIEENAMKVTAQTMQDNGVEAYDLVCGNILAGGETLEAITRQGPYHLILANIVADVLMPMAGLMPGLLAPGGQAVLSGILDERAQEVLDTYTNAGFTCLGQRSRQGWTMLLVGWPAE